MTRVNVIPVEELSRQHLIAEYRELPRIFELAVRWMVNEKDTKPLPENYTLGTGHCRFFYDKGYFLHNRYKQLVEEMLRRGYNPQFRQVNQVCFIMPWEDTPWVPDEIALAPNRARIAERNGGTSSHS